MTVGYFQEKNFIQMIVEITQQESADSKDFNSSHFFDIATPLYSNERVCLMI